MQLPFPLLLESRMKASTTFPCLEHVFRNHYTRVNSGILSTKIVMTSSQPTGILLLAFLLWYFLHSPYLSILLISICICNIYIWKTLFPILCVKGRPPFRRVYNVDNAARRFQLEFEILEYSQGNKWVNKYYFGFINLLTEFTELVFATVPDEAIQPFKRMKLANGINFL